MAENFESFTEQQLKLLDNYVTNTTSNVFALRNLPEVIKGALFSRYSRSGLGLRSLLLKEFIDNEEAEFAHIVFSGDANAPDQQQKAVKKAQSFYDRILDGYGDDSIGELGGAHLALENISMLAAKIIEDCRIGGSPLEKSARYVYFDQKVDGEYMFYREPVLMTSAFRKIYVDICNLLFETYSKLLLPVTALIEGRFPKAEETSNLAYRAALRGKVLDCLRGLLPASTLTNVGIYGNGRFFETLIHKLHCHNFAELEDIGSKAFEELSKVIPSFIRRSSHTHPHHQLFAQFLKNMDAEVRLVAERYTADLPPTMHSSPGVRLTSYDPDAVYKVAASLLYPYTDHSLDELTAHCRSLPEEDLARILDTGCNFRENRRHKSPRGLENAFFTFEIISDFGCYRDLQRHRMLTQERQLLTCNYGYVVPHDLKGTEMEGEYCSALDKAKEVYDQIAADLPEEAQYAVPLAYQLRWYFNVNLRALQWLCELRSSPAGHANYRLVAQGMAKSVCQTFPIFERFFKFVDYDGYELGRLMQEQRVVEKRKLI